MSPRIPLSAIATSTAASLNSAMWTALKATILGELLQSNHFICCVYTRSSTHVYIIEDAYAPNIGCVDFIMKLQTPYIACYRQADIHHHMHTQTERY